MARLFSKHHDQFHVHKVLGGAALVHFLVRAHLLIARGAAFPASEPFASVVFCILLHVLLNASSFIFALPAKRNPLAPMIWPAYRAHNAIFAGRNALGALVLLAAERGLLLKNNNYWCFFLFGATNEDHDDLASVVARIAGRAGFVWASMAAADAVTAHHANGQETTRGIPYFGGKSPQSVRALKSFYMQCQFHATFLAVTDATLSFFCVLPIQLASFGMTLARKRKISSWAWHVVYAAALWSVYGFILCRPVTTRVAAAGALGGLAKELRHHYRVPKYALWFSAVAAHELLVTYALGEIPATGPRQRLAFWLMFLAAARYVYRLGRVFFGGGGGGDQASADTSEVPLEDEEDEDDDDARGGVVKGEIPRDEIHRGDVLRAKAD